MSDSLIASDTMDAIAFDVKELEVIREEPDYMNGGTIPIYSTPISLRDGFVATFQNKKPVWMLNNCENMLFTPSVIPDNIARGFCFEGKMLPREEFGGKDMFGIEWVYVDVAGGSMVKPGNPFLEDISEWREKIVFPDIDSWDWDASAKLNEGFLSTGKANHMWLLNGCWFERLISFMDFQYAAMALIDEDEVEEVKELTDKLTDLYIHLVDVCCDTYDKLDGFEIHDDWASQKSPFFSYDVGEEVYLPFMKRFNDHVHSRGKFISLHSCGHGESRADIFEQAGFDAWTPMAMNNTEELFQKFGKTMNIGIVIKVPEGVDDYSENEDAQRELAREVANKFCIPGTSCFLSSYSDPAINTHAFREELYKQSRINYAAA